MALNADDLLFLCDQLASVQSTDADAALAYHQMTVEHPELLKPVHSWLYCRAAAQHNLEHQQGLELFARTFRDKADAREYFAERGWTTMNWSTLISDSPRSSRQGRFLRL